MPQTKVTFSIGQGYDKDGKSIPLVHAKLKGVLKTLANYYGGYSLTETNGGWINGEGLLVQEDSVAIVVYTELPVEIHRAMAGDFAVLFNQESVLLTVEPVSVLEFIGQPKG